jgi:DNA-binding NarL/FixJ family response regulator
VQGAKDGDFHYTEGKDQHQTIETWWRLAMRVLIADDQPEVRSALRLLLEQEREISCVTEAGGASEVLAALRAECTDLLLMDWELPEMDPRWLLPLVRRACPGAAVVALSGRPEAYRAAINAGVDLFVSKGDPPERLLQAVRVCLHRMDSRDKGGSV